MERGGQVCAVAGRWAGRAWLREEASVPGSGATWGHQRHRSGLGAFSGCQLNVRGCVWNVALGLWVLGAH